MAKLLDLLVSAEGFVPVAGRVYAQDGDMWVNPYEGTPEYILNVWWGESHATHRCADDGTWDCGYFTLADDYQTAIITAESILEARACQ